jgi:hypothetical protein
MRQKSIGLLLLNIFFVCGTFFSLVGKVAAQPCDSNDSNGSGGYNSGECKVRNDPTCASFEKSVDCIGLVAPADNAYMCCVKDKSPEASSGDTLYTDPTPVSDSTPAATGGGASCTKYGVQGVCMPKNAQCSSDIRFEGVCGDATFL